MSETVPTKLTEVNLNGKKVVINKFLKNFLFKAFKARKDFKGIEKILGKVDSITVSLSVKESTLTATGNGKDLPTPMTYAEAVQFLKNFSVKEETLKESKIIFIHAVWATQAIHIRRVELDGTPKDFEL